MRDALSNQNIAYIKIVKCINLNTLVMTSPHHPESIIYFTGKFCRNLLSFKYRKEENFNFKNLTSNRLWNTNVGFLLENCNIGKLDTLLPRDLLMASAFEVNPCLQLLQIHSHYQKTKTSLPNWAQRQYPTLEYSRIATL